MEEKQNEVHTGLKTLARGSLLVTLSMLLAKFLGYLCRVIIARNFGPEVYGLLSLTLMISGWIMIVSKFGLTGGIMRFIPLRIGQNSKAKAHYLYRTALVILLAIGIISGALLFIFSDYIAVSIFRNQGLAIFLKFFSVIIPVTMLTDYSLATLLGFEKIGWHSLIYNVLENAVELVVLAVMIFLGFKINAILFAYLISMLAALAAAFFISRKLIATLKAKSKPLSKKEKSSELRELLSYSWPLMFFGFAWQILHWTDSLIIGIFMSAKDVGYYNAASPISMFFNATASLFIPLFFPLITREFARSKNVSTVRELSKQVTKWIFFINLPGLIILLVFPGTIINILFGSQYLAATSALRFLAIGMFINSIFPVSERLISMLGKSKLALYDVLAVSLFNVLFDIVLVPKLGITGAAIATAVSFVLLNALFVYQANKHLSIIPLRRKMLPITLAALAAMVMLYLLKAMMPSSILSVLVISMTFILTYILLALLFGGLDRNDLMIIKTIKEKVFRKKSAEV